MTSVFSWKNSVILCSASLCTPKPNLPVTPGISWLPTFTFHSPVMKSTSSFLVLAPESLYIFISSVQFSRSVMSDSATPWLTAHQASLSITNSWSLLTLMPINSVMSSSYLILCCPLLLLPSIPPSIRVFSNESILLMMWPKYWNFSFSISPSSEHSGLLSFGMDWLDLLAVQGTLKSLL